MKTRISKIVPLDTPCRGEVAEILATAAVALLVETALRMPSRPMRAASGSRAKEL